jgi:hypothetical protein
MGRFLSGAVFLFLVIPQSVSSQTCFPPERPYVPSDSNDVQEYRDLIGRDFETYITSIQGYFRCLEEERARAFEEAQEVSQEYGRFLQIVNQ